MQWTSRKGIQDETWLDEKGDPLRIVQEIKIRPYWQIVYAQAIICSRQCDGILTDKQITQF